MPDPESVDAIRAAVDAIAPGDDMLGPASSYGVHEHVVALAEQYLTGFADLVAGLLNAYAAERGSTFVELDDDARREVLRALVAEEAQDIRDAADTLFAFTLGGMYSEWSGYDRATRALEPPAAWERVGFRGPSTKGRPS